MLNCFKRLFGFDKSNTKETEMTKPFCVNYIENGNLEIELQFYCYALNEKDAEKCFFENYECAYHDITKIEEI